MNESIFFYDGDCGFCNSTVLFLLERTKPTTLLFCPLQSEYAVSFFTQHGYRQPDLTTAYFFHHGRLYQKSSAVLRSVGLVEGFFRHLSLLLIIPSFIRDSTYDFVASVRKHIRMGKGSCRLLTPQERKRFLSL